MNDAEINSQVQQRLRAAVKSVEAPPMLEDRIRGTLRAYEPWPHRTLIIAWAGALAAVLVLALTGVAYQRGYLRFTPASQEAYISSIYAQLAPVMQVGLGDHVHCAVFRKYPKNPPDFEQFAKSLGAQYAGLIDAVQGRVPPEYRLVMAHHCGYRDRRFVHLIFKHGSSLMSLVITDREPGEDLAWGPAISSAHVQRFQIARFETPKHLIFVISDLSGDRNAQIAEAIAPSVRAVLNKMDA